MALKDNPALKWAAIAIIGAGLALLLFRFIGGSGDVHSADSMKQTLTITCSETGDTWTIMRGDMEQRLYTRAHQGKLNLQEGFTNPATGKPTGFPDNWDQIVERVEQEVADAKARRGQ